ncbi:MAG: hypothetical protein RM347_024925 [Nostoc sp. ChiQUE02]|uniref:hypothetical protein n=1 Tax=Nostoc sp. ChiQUE02 TaxID=3075377 RepID=UPI002AD1EEF2|nr:hypothetical protein [Nostoc sp. ChiQUE02]MDZ8229265.1 hypothetical protein [Nostoc sp. ChiQUE02]
MESKHNEWKDLQIFTVTIVAMIFSSAVVEAASISESNIEERLLKVRKHIQQRGEEFIDSYCTVSSRQDYLEGKDIFLGASAMSPPPPPPWNK